MIDAVRNRRSIRRYEPQTIEPDLVEHLRESVLRSPSSRGLRPWEVLFVADPATLEELSRAKPSFAGFLGTAPLGVIFTADEGVSDCWVEDCSIAATILQLTATDLGLGSCWIQIRGRQHDEGSTAEQWVRDRLGLPDDRRVLCMIAVGYPAQSPPPYASADLAWEKTLVLGPATT